MRNKIMSRYLDFDLLKFLDDHNIDYKESGKNIGRNWIGISECIFCSAGGYHLGIHKQSKSVSCFVCGESCTLPFFISDSLNISVYESNKIIKEYIDYDIDIEVKETGNKTILPSNIGELNKKAVKYLKKRNFDPEYLKNIFKLKATGHHSTLSHNNQDSDFKFRIIIPIYMNRKLVAYTGRDYTEQRDPRYKHPFLEACIIPPSSAIYNLDNVNDKKIIIVEGPTDVWRMGDNTVSLQGVKYTKEQIRYLAQMELQKVVILFDNGAENQAIKLSNALSGVVPKISVAFLDKEDPANLSDIEALKLKHNLLYS